MKILEVIQSALQSVVLRPEVHVGVSRGELRMRELLQRDQRQQDSAENSVRSSYVRVQAGEYFDI